MARCIARPTSERCALCRAEWRPGDTRWPEHDEPGATAGEELDRVETLAEIVQEWADGDVHEYQMSLQDAVDRMAATLERLGAPPMTDAERAAVAARIEG